MFSVRLSLLVTSTVTSLLLLLAPFTSHADDDNTAVATFAGGCFWCVEESFDKLPGVLETISGYTGGQEENPTYRQVAGGMTSHTEAVQVTYDPSVVSYAALVEAFWRMMDPTDADGQFVDRGQQYRPEIFVHNEQQRAIAEASKQRLQQAGIFSDDIIVPITAAQTFYQAEDYHQDYYRKNPVRYRFYTRNSGRYQFVEQVWGDDSEIDVADYQDQDYLTANQ